MATAQVDIFPMGVGGALAVVSSAGPASYSAGGFDPGFPSGRLIFAAVDGTPGGFVAQVDYVNKKLLVFWGDYSNASDGVAVEVPNATNLSAVTFKVLALVRA